jgi:hypothetical protein
MVVRQSRIESVGGSNPGGGGKIILCSTPLGRDRRRFESRLLTLFESIERLTRTLSARPRPSQNCDAQSDRNENNLPSFAICRHLNIATFVDLEQFYISRFVNRPPPTTLSNFPFSTLRVAVGVSPYLANDILRGCPLLEFLEIVGYHRFLQNTTPCSLGFLKFDCQMACFLPADVASFEADANFFLIFGSKNAILVHLWNL